VRALEREIRALMRSLAPELLALPGCSALCAAQLVGQMAGADVAEPARLHERRSPGLGSEFRVRSASRRSQRPMPRECSWPPAASRCW
jgi:hypothetical protein